MRRIARELIQEFDNRSGQLNTLLESTQQKVKVIEQDKNLSGDGRLRLLRETREAAAARARELGEGFAALVTEGLANAHQQARTRFDEVRAIPDGEKAARALVLTPLSSALMTNPQKVLRAWRERFDQKTDRVLLEDMLEAAAQAGAQQAALPDDPAHPLQRLSFPASFYKAQEDLLPLRPAAEREAYIDMMVAKHMPEKMNLLRDVLQYRARSYTHSNIDDRPGGNLHANLMLMGVKDWLADFREGGKYAAA